MKLLRKSLTLFLPAIFAVATPGAALTVGGVAVAAGLSSCASPNRVDARQDARVDNRVDDRYDRRRGD